jgi:hypothetical protein
MSFSKIPPGTMVNVIYPNKICDRCGGATKSLCTTHKTRADSVLYSSSGNPLLHFPEVRLIHINENGTETHCSSLTDEYVTPVNNRELI